MSILGPGTYPPGILGNGGGLLSLLQPPPQAPAYGSDAWAEQGGHGAMLWRQLAQAGAWNAMDPTKAGDVFSPEVLSLLAPRFQEGAAKKVGKGK